MYYYPATIVIVPVLTRSEQTPSPSKDERTTTQAGSDITTHFVVAISLPTLVMQMMRRMPTMKATNYVVINERRNAVMQLPSIHASLPPTKLSYAEDDFCSAAFLRK